MILHQPVRPAINAQFEPGKRKINVNCRYYLSFITGHHLSPSEVDFVPERGLLTGLQMIANFPP
jgi:hypothetical protein